MVAVFDLFDALLKIEVLCMLGVQRSTSESGRRITLDGDELCARVCVCVVLRVCVCVRQILRENKPKEGNVCVCDGKLLVKQGIHKEIVRAR